ncbi:LysM peptidoglycan-binding domain-containing protein [Roseibium salinum]|uniref:LysM peptidoglycan-binding domain-containing protein n=1 Tax=Roseibium salinum TaxID=1604349 RepID=UPI003610D027
MKPGDYDVGLEVHDDQGTAIEHSEQRLAVSLAEDGNEKPLVVLNTPDGPSDILQKPAGEQQVAGVQGKEDMSGSETAGTVVAAVQETPDDADPDVSGQQAAAPGGAGQAPEGGDASAVAVGAAPAGQQTGIQQDTAGVAAPGTRDETGKTSQNPETAAPAVTASAEANSGEASALEADTSAPAVTVEAVESEKDRVFIAGTGVPGSSVRVYVGEDFQGEAKVNSSGRWLVEGDKNVAEGNVEVRADLIAEGGDSVDARAAVTFSKEEDRQIVLTKVVATGVSGNAGTQGAEVQKALPVVIIRKGDNLWRISRRLYGDGVRYTTIYQANKEQIRNPDLIYPGQVFLTPEEDLNWASPDEENGRNG